MQSFTYYFRSMWHGLLFLAETTIFRNVCSPYLTHGSSLDHWTSHELNSCVCLNSSCGWNLTPTFISFQVVRFFFTSWELIPLLVTTNWERNSSSILHMQLQRLHVETRIHTSTALFTRQKFNRSPLLYNLSMVEKFNKLHFVWKDKRTIMFGLSSPQWNLKFNHCFSFTRK